MGPPCFQVYSIWEFISLKPRDVIIYEIKLFEKRSKYSSFCATVSQPGFCRTSSDLREKLWNRHKFLNTRDKFEWFYEMSWEFLSGNCKCWNSSPTQSYVCFVLVYLRSGSSGYEKFILGLTLVDLQLDAQNSYLFTYNAFIKILYLFRALPCSSLGGLRRNCVYVCVCVYIYIYIYIYIYHLVSSLSAGDCLVDQLRKN